MATEGIRQTMRKRGINANLYLMSQHNQSILQQVLTGDPSVPYLPFVKRGRFNPDAEPTVREMRDDVVDYSVARLSDYVRKIKKGDRTPITVALRDVHPILISEREMARMQQRYNPSLGALYSTEGPMTERHQDEDILRGEHRTLQRRPSLAMGGAGTKK